MNYQAEIDAWHQKRLERLQAPEGWLSLAGLFWLKDGDNSFGSAGDNALVFPNTAPAHAGTLTLAHGKVTLTAPATSKLLAAGKPATSLALVSDKDAEPTKIDLGEMSFVIIERGGKLAVRLRDHEAKTRKTFHGIERFPVAQAYRLNARFEPYTPAKTLEVPTVLGTIEPSPCPGAVVFNWDGKEYRLDTVDEGDDDLFIIFGDKTNGKETYAPGRFVYVSKPKDGTTVLDFNKAYNPPCAFTPFATCPLPPPQNKLPIRIEAGEKKYGEGHPG